MEQQPNKNKERLKEITDSIEQGISELFTSERYKNYLRTMSRFHRYSVNNTMLIYMQRPDATLVAGFNKWRDQFGRSVMRGEKGIKIIAPTPYKVKREQEKLDPDTKAPMLDKDGHVILEEVEIQIPMFRVVSVFDVSQTDGKPLPTIAADLTGNVAQYDVFMEALRRSSPVPIAFERMAADMDGYLHKTDQRIAIRVGMSETQTVSAVVHEIAHAKLHNHERHRETTDKDTSPPKDRQTEEIEAESISYAVCAYYGIDTGENSFGYIAAWSKDKELSVLKSSLETINKTASSLISDIDRHFSEICKERGIDPKAKEQQAEAEQKEEIAPTSVQRSNEIQGEPPLGGGKITDAPVIPYQPAVSIPELETGYHLPDPSLNMGYLADYENAEDMLPLSAEKARELFERDMDIYMLHKDDEAELVFDLDDIEGHPGLFGVSREDWDAEIAHLERYGWSEETSEHLEQVFRESPGNAFAIYQLKDGEDLRQRRFEGLKDLKNAGLQVERDNYDLMFAAPLHAEEGYGPIEYLHQIYERFNMDKPLSFQGHSVSVSDIIALKLDGQVSCHYVDRMGFQEIPGFTQPENHLKTAEMTVEDDYNMIDGIFNNGPKATVAELEQQARSGQRISLLDLAEAIGRERDLKKKAERPSVLEKLRSQTPVRTEKTKAAHKSAEREY